MSGEALQVRFPIPRSCGRYDGQEFRVFRSMATDPATLAGNYVRSILVASDGRIRVGTPRLWSPDARGFFRSDRDELVRFS